MVRRHILAMAVLITVAGCGKRFTTWPKKTFKQADTVAGPIERARNYLKTIRLYHQFETLGIFDIMWLSDDVRHAYAQLYALKHGLTAPEHSAYERNQLALNEHQISFYVLAYQPSIPQLKPFDMAESNWAAYISLDGVSYPSSSIKMVNVFPPEYRAFFGKRYNQFQTPYLISFDAFTGEGKPLITPATKEITLYVSTAEKKGHVSWPLIPGTTQAQ